MRAYEIVGPDGIDALAMNKRADPLPEADQVLVRVRANSINFRDLSTILDPEPRRIPYPRIPNSDGAGEVLAVGPKVTSVKPGDRVAGCFFTNWVDGGITAEIMGTAMGGAVDGMLAEQVVLPESGVVRIPDHLTYEEAATLPCAGLTAWRALIEEGKLKAGETVVLLGTGGVSLFALQFAKMHGARVIITSSSDEKLARAKAMGADVAINYRTHPEWQQEALKHTDGRGVDHVVEVGGSGTLARSLDAVRVGGHIALIGILSQDKIDATAIMRKSVKISGIYVGSKRMFADMNAAIALSGLNPVIDQVFSFDEAPGAYHAMKAAGHFGKIVIAIDP